MKLIKVAAGVLNQTPLDWNGNRERIEQAIADAREQGATVLCLPELCITGYGCEDAFQSFATARMAWRVLHEMLPQTRGMIVSLGLPVVYQHSIFNAACLVVDGRIAGFVAKRFLAGEGIHYEPRWFKPWPQDTRGTLNVEGIDYPFGDYIFDAGGVRIGFEICEDAWVASRPGSTMAQKGVDIILNPSASHFAFAKNNTRERFILDGSRSFGVTYIYTNMVGNEAGRAIYDGGATIAMQGEKMSRGPRFGFHDCHVTSAVVDVDYTQMSQARRSVHGSFIHGDPEETVRCDFEFPQIEPEPSRATSANWEELPQQKEEEFSRAVSLGLFDYLRKTRSHGFVVSLSGGADSTATAVLCHLMVRFGVRSIGVEGFKRKLSHIPAIQDLKREEEITGALLLCVYQSTGNSSKETREAAQTVAEDIGAEFFTLNVEEARADYVRLISNAIGRELTWEKDDIALQNIQARVRAPSVWMLANLRNALLLSTSNRSEAAVGYATMDGDTCGGVSPIAGIDKAFLRQWLTWMETTGPYQVGPMPFLEVVNALKPTAELRPLAAEQTDEEDLMPYEVLDAVERSAIHDKKSPLEVYRTMRVRFPEYERQDLCLWVERFFRLWCRNQWKRERYAPSFHLDDENLDPKTWCRFPILSGGYEREIQELREYAEEEDNTRNVETKETIR